MNNFLGPVFALLALATIVWLLQQASLRQKRDREFLTRLKPLDIKGRVEFIKKYGANSNSFLSTYPGFNYFLTSAEDGAIPFVNTSYGWVAAAEPLTEPAKQLALLQTFAHAADAANKLIVMLPVDEKTAEVGVAAGYHSVLIGSEPYFKASEYPPTGSTWSTIIVTAKQFSNKGATVSEFKFSDLSSAEKKEFEDIKNEWLNSRKTEPLGFLNQVEPWLHADYKRYFKIETPGRVHAFIAALPIMATNSWYLIDVMRKSGTSPGTTELLVLQAMKILFDSGAKEISLGMAPLSQIDTAAKYTAANIGKNKLFYRILSWVYQNGQQFYGFDSLYQYKMKFKPTEIRPCFALLRRRPNQNKYLELGRVAISISQALMPKGIARSTFLNTIHVISRLSLGEWLRENVRSSIVVRSMPPTWPRLILRCRFTVITVCFYLLLFVMLKTGTIRGEIAFRFLAQTQNLSSAEFTLDIISLAIFSFSLEYLAGAAITAAVILIPTALFGSVSTQLIVSLTKDLHFDLSPFIFQPYMLGFGALGALQLFLKFRLAPAAVGLALIFSTMALSHSYIPLTNILGYFLGLAIAWVALNETRA